MEGDLTRIWRHIIRALHSFRSGSTSMISCFINSKGARPLYHHGLYLHDDIMALTVHYKWEMNMVGASQGNKTKADTVEEEKGTKKNTYETGIWQYISESLCYKFGPTTTLFILFQISLEQR